MNRFMNTAILEAYSGISKKHGGPFGCVIVKNGEIVGRGHNEVLLNLDPTCHGEVQAIRDACRNLKTFDLSGCELYTSAAPCPMCAGAIQWANISKCYYSCNIQDTNDIGFRDDIFYKNPLKPEELDREQGLKLFEAYTNSDNKRY